MGEARPPPCWWLGHPGVKFRELGGGLRGERRGSPRGRAPSLASQARKPGARSRGGPPLGRAAAPAQPPLAREWPLSGYNKRGWRPACDGGVLQGKGWVRGGVCHPTPVKSTGRSAKEGLRRSRYAALAPSTRLAPLLGKGAQRRRARRGAAVESPAQPSQGGRLRQGKCAACASASRSRAWESGGSARALRALLAAGPPLRGGRGGGWGAELEGFLLRKLDDVQANGSPPDSREPTQSHLA